MGARDRNRSKSRRGTASAVAGNGNTPVPVIEPVPTAVWPACLPHPDQEILLSVSCGNSHYHWAALHKSSQHFIPHLFWRTTALTEHDMKQADPNDALKRYLPESIQEMIFGLPVPTAATNSPSSSASAAHSSLYAEVECTSAAALKNFCTKRISFFTIYVVSTNKENEKGLSYMFSKLPCRIYSIMGSDFFQPQLETVDDTADTAEGAATDDKQQQPEEVEYGGAYPGMGTDRLAACRGALYVMDAPSISDAADEDDNVKKKSTRPLLVVDAGTALTYTAVSADRQIIGGGISAGFGLELAALGSRTYALPTLRIDQDLDLDNPPPLFARNTSSGILTAVLRSKVSLIREVIKGLCEELQGDKATSEANPLDMVEDNDDDITRDGGIDVCVTGSDGEILYKALLPEQSHDDEHNGSAKLPARVTPASSSALPSNVTLKYERHCIHFGLVNVLRELFDKHQSTMSTSQDDDDAIRQDMLGLRVAKMFDNEIFRGTVVYIMRESTIDEDFFKVLFDDNDVEDMTVNEIYDALGLYAQKGESFNPSTREEIEVLRGKLKASKNAAQRLQTESRSVQAYEARLLREAKLQEERAKAAAEKEMAAAAERARQAEEARIEKARLEKEAKVEKARLDEEKRLRKEAEARAKKERQEEEAKAKKEREEEERARDAAVARARASARTPKEDKAQKPSSRRTSESPGAKRGLPSSEDEAPTSKKKKKQSLTLSSTAPPFNFKDPESFIGRRVCNYFQNAETEEFGLFFGTITEYFPAEIDRDGDESAESYWHVKYDDDDEEDYDIEQMKDIARIYKNNFAMDPNP